MTAAMFGIRLSSLFRSRWMALGWAVLICLSAIQFAGGRSDDDSSAAQDAETAKAVNIALHAM